MAIIKPNRGKRKYDDIQMSQDISKSAERLVCEWIEESITDDVFGGPVIGMVNRSIDGRSADLILIVPDHGVLVIEVKAYDRNFIELFTDDETIKVKSIEKPERKHPYYQGREYALTIMNFLNKKNKEYVKLYGQCAVVPIVAMPNISDDEYMELGLDMPYDIEGTLTMDWLKDKETFRIRFKQAVRYAFRRVNAAEFDDNYYKNIINFFRLQDTLIEVYGNINLENEVIQEIKEEKKIHVEETSTVLSGDEILEILKNSSNLQIEEEKKENWDYSRRYILDYNLGLDKIKDIVNAAIRERNKGTKIILLCKGFDVEGRFKLRELFNNRLKDKITEDDLEKYNVEQKNSWSTFLFEVHYLDYTVYKELAPVVYKNGHDAYTILESNENEERLERLSDKESQYEEIIQLFSKDTNYNDEQFKVEHYGIENDILVTAGAGTGKTFSMLGRIAFLIHSNILAKDGKSNLADMIYMMTFTNNSTDEMRSRLISHFEKYYLLTKKDCYMMILEQIGDMKIKTIDSMAKMILTKYAHILGLSKDFEIKSGNYVKKNIIKRNVQEYLNNNEGINQFISDKSLRAYEMEQVISKIMGYVSNRNIYLDGDSCILSEHEGGENEFRDFLQTVVRGSMDEYREHNINNNNLEMESIVTWLSQCKEQIQEEEIFKQKETSENKYLFVDEFQDTDKHQISLIAFFARLYGLKLFVVGDRKQSIYGFRGAKDTAFAELKKALDEREFKTLKLKKNYRTDKQLLTLFDELFKERFKGSKFVYEADDELIGQLELLKPINKIEEIFKKVTLEDESEEELGDKLDEIIQTLRGRIELEPTKEEKKIHKIAILTRKNEEKEIIRRLNNKYRWEINFDTEGDFYRQDAVIDFYKLVCALLNAGNPEYIYNLSLTPYCKIHIPRGKFYFNEDNPIQTLQDLDEYLKDKHDDFSFIKYQKKLRKIAALKLLRELVNENKPWERYIPESIVEKDTDTENKQFKNRLKQLRNNYQQCLDQLFQTLIESNGTDYITLNQIKTNLGICIITKQSMELYNNVKEGKNRLLELGDDSEKKESEGKEPNIEVICTTIHKSKGLEYRSVILPFTTSDIGKISGKEVILDHDIDQVTYIEYEFKKKKYGSSYPVSYYKSHRFDRCLESKQANQIAEELRILYVAMTRAEAEFYYMVNPSEVEKNRSKKECWANYLDK